MMLSRKFVKYPKRCKLLQHYYKKGRRGSAVNKKFTNMVTIWPEATANKFSSDQATELGWDGEATSIEAWKLEDIVVFSRPNCKSWETCQQLQTPSIQNKQESIFIQKKRGKLKIVNFCIEKKGENWK